MTGSGIYYKYYNISDNDEYYGIEIWSHKTMAKTLKPGEIPLEIKRVLI